ncbi:MAG: NAD(P)/FAD-dependent oxidoreductase [Armatimonadetes bacterium]|nr:NAD(P)/FAD-dependent oxidoreductase [Armatimonadota bacterium]MDW8123090.1 NAD(P)/FAD-dependent oxidoreductase [Armatimonadota bacterium]
MGTESWKSRYDAIVIGTGHNGLVAAALLARAGLSVAVFESRPVIGGSCTTEILWDRFRVSTAAYVCGILHPRIIRELDLTRRGFHILKREPSSFTPLPDAGYLLLGPDDTFSAEQIARHSQKDVAAFQQYERDLEQIGALVEDLFLAVPHSFAQTFLTTILEWAPVATRFLRLPPSSRLLLTQMMTSSAWDILDQRFHSEILKTTLVTDGIIGSPLSPTFPGTGLLLLHHTTGSVTGKRGVWGYVQGGMGALAQAIADAATEKGATIVTNCSVAQIVVSNGQAVGVALEDGSVISAQLILSNADPKRTFLKLLDPSHLPEDFVKAIQNLKMSAASFKINLVCDRLPNFTVLPGDQPGPQHRGTIHLCPSLEYIQKAFADYFANRPSAQPIVEMCLPTVVDDSLAPAGYHIASLFVQYAPYQPEGGWERRKTEFVEAVLRVVDQFAPGFSSSVLHVHALSPQDLEDQFLLTGGNIFHGDITLDQIFSFRPVPGWSQYRTPIKGLYLCGSGAHPGGGVTGCPGYNAAKVALKDWKRRRV